MSSEGPVRLHYFEANGRSTFIRAILYYKQIPFENVFYNFEEWAKVKHSGDFEFNQLPMLEVSGKKMVQSLAIVFTLPRKYGISMGESIEEEYLTYSTISCLDDIFPKFICSVYGWTPETIAAIPEKQKEFFEIHAPFFLQKFEARFKQYGGKHFIGNTFGLSDIIITSLLFIIFRNPSRRETWEPILLQYAPSLAAYTENVANNELAEYFAKGFINCPV